ncbi:hypothetical protein GF340_04875, partial [Candidatus Peregrinibacteria bacterium]|nr:hypothetical protein [Candidatus Peregrinibacteria bacterium]
MEIKRLSAIPLPKIVQDLTISVPRDEEHISYYDLSKDANNSKKKKLEELQISANTHAFYLGKFKATTIWQNISDKCGFEAVDQGIYSHETYVELMKLIKKHLLENEKCTIVIGPILSELFNGKEDIDGYLKPDEQLKYIKKLTKKYGIKPDQIDIRRMEEEPYNQGLFEAATKAKDEHGDQFTKYAYEHDGPLPPLTDDNVDALLIAKYLHRAATQNPIAREIFKGLLTDQQKSNSS